MYIKLKEIARAQSANSEQNTVHSNMSIRGKIIIRKSDKKKTDILFRAKHRAEICCIHVQSSVRRTRRMRDKSLRIYGGEREVGIKIS